MTFGLIFPHVLVLRLAEIVRKVNSIVYEMPVETLSDAVYNAKRWVGESTMRRAEALREQLEQDIVTGHFKPGERLDEQSLATRFGVSRTPIREALMQLASTGMVELQPRRGAFVASLSLREVLERFETMAALEGMCGALAARRITDGSVRDCRGSRGLR